MHRKRCPIFSAEEFGQWILQSTLGACLRFRRYWQRLGIIACEDVVVFGSTGPFIQSSCAFIWKGMAGAHIRHEAIEAITHGLIQAFLVSAGLIEKLFSI